MSRGLFIARLFNAGLSVRAEGLALGLARLGALRGEQRLYLAQIANALGWADDESIARAAEELLLAGYLLRRRDPAGEKPEQYRPYLWQLDLPDGPPVQPVADAVVDDIARCVARFAASWELPATVAWCRARAAGISEASIPELVAATRVSRRSLERYLAVWQEAGCARLVSERRPLRVALELPVAAAPAIPAWQERLIDQVIAANLLGEDYHGAPGERLEQRLARGASLFACINRAEAQAGALSGDDRVRFFVRPLCELLDRYPSDASPGNHLLVRQVLSAAEELLERGEMRAPVYGFGAFLHAAADRRAAGFGEAARPVALFEWKSRRAAAAAA